MSYQPLSPQEVDAIAGEYFRERSQRTESREQPVHILVAGQPGAGKSAAAIAARHELAAAGGYIHIDADRMRERIDTKGERPTSEETQKDAGRLVSALRREATAAHRNIIEEGTFRDPAGVTSFLEGRRNQGYQAEMLIVATAREESILGIYQRYEYQHQAGAENPRFVSEKYHDETMRAFPETLARNEESLARIRVVTRSGEMLYDSQAAQNRHSSAREALQAGQTLTDTRLKAVADSFNMLKESAAARGAEKSYLDAIESHGSHCTMQIQDRIHRYAEAARNGNAAELAKDYRFSAHSHDEIGRVAYFRGVYVKNAEFNGVTADLKAFDTKMADRSNVRQLPDPPGTSRAEPGRSKERSEPGLSL